MKLFSKIVLIIVVLIAVIVGGLAVFVATFDANDYKGQVITLVKKQTGRDLTIEGNLKLAVYPDIALEVDKASLSNASGFNDEAFATISAGKVSVKLLPLLKKQIKADEISLQGLQLSLQRKANGSTNWDDLSQSKPTEENATVKKEPAKVVQDLMDNLSIAGVNLENAKIHWLDEQAKQDITLSSVNLSTGKYKSDAPLPVDLSLVVTQKNPAMSITAKGNTVVNLSNGNQNFSFSKLKLNTNIKTAQLGKGSIDASLSGEVKGSPQKISVTGLNLQTKLIGDLIPEGAINTDVSGKLDFDVNGQLLSIIGMKLNSDIVGKPLAGGNIKAQINGDARLDLAKQHLTIPNLALDATLKGGHIKNGTANVALKGNTQFDLNEQLLNINTMKTILNAKGELFKGGKVQSNISGDLLVNLARSHIKSPSLSLNSQVEGGLIPGGKLDQTGKGTLDMNWANNKGSINLADLLVKLAGMEIKGSQVKIEPLASKPAISGQFQTNTFNLKQLLKTLGIEPPVTSDPTALSQVQANFGLKADTDKADLQQLKVKLDKSILSGSLGIANFSAPATLPSLKPIISIDTINLDGYLAPTSTKAKAQSAAQSKAAAQQELLPIETLRKLTLDGDFNIEKLVINKIKMANVRAKINAKQGLIVINPANASLYSGKYTGRITLDAKQATPTMKMHHEVVGLRSEGLLFDLFQDKYLSGGTKLITDLNSRGNSINALLQNLNGTTKIAFNDGTIRDSKLAEKVSLAVKVFEKKETQDGKSTVKFTGLSGDWKTTNGIFKTDNLQLLAPLFKISGSGTADVAKQVLNMKLRIGPNTKKGEKPLYAPLTITGTFSDPKFGLDLKDLIKTLAAQDIEKAKLEAKQKLEEKKQQIQQKLAAEKAAQKKKLKQKLENTKTDAIQKLKAKTGEQLGNKLLNKIGGGSDKETQPENETSESPEPENKSVEDQVKDKLKNKLKGLF